MSDQPLAPHIIHAMDQDRAAVADLVKRAHDHIPDCTAGGICPGVDLFNIIWHLDLAHARRLLLAAVATLGRGEVVWRER